MISPDAETPADSPEWQMDGIYGDLGDARPGLRKVTRQPAARAEIERLRNERDRLRREIAESRRKAEAEVARLRALLDELDGDR